jgi:lipopolysaccharide transport protein LptA
VCLLNATHAKDKAVVKPIGSVAQKTEAVKTVSPKKKVGLMTKKVNQLKITSNSSELDYLAHTLIFVGNVVVDDPQIELDADLMKIVFTPEQEIESFKATSKFDDVVIVVHREGEDDLVAKGEEVFYEALTGKVTLSGESTSIKNGSITNIGAKKVIFFLEDNGLTNFKIIGRSTTVMDRDSNLLQNRTKKKKAVKNVEK